MKKQIINRALFGIPSGIAIGYLVTIIISALFAKGHYSSAPPELIERMGNEINAVILQTFLCAVMGAGFAASSVIWEIENWSIAKQSGIYFVIISLITLPIAYFANWMEHSLAGFISYFGIFIAIYLVVWLIQYLFWKRKVKAINDKVKEKPGN
jgi:hypothetical protein